MSDDSDGAAAAGDRPGDTPGGPGGAGRDPGEETRRLLDALQDWARRALPAPPSGHAGPECQWCPLCQVASVLRGEHPELTERMAEAGTAIAQAVRAVADSAAARAAGAGETVRTARGGGDAARPRPRPGRRVQRIALSEPDPPAGPPVAPPDPGGTG